MIVNRTYYETVSDFHYKKLFVMEVRFFLCRKPRKVLKMEEKLRVAPKEREQST